MSEKPNPGSDEAIAQGCTCPMIDNNHGAGIVMHEGDAPLFWMDGSCPIHRPFRSIINELGIADWRAGH